MIPTYDIADFSPFYSIEKQFLVVPFEQLIQPDGFGWPHKHNFFEILWIRQAQSKHIIDHHEQDLSRNDIYFMSPGQIHLFEKYDSVKGDCIMFTEEFFILNFLNKEALQKLSFFDNSYSQPYVKPDAGSAVTLESILKLLYEEFSREQHSKLALGSILYLFLTAIERLYSSQSGSHSKPNQVLLLNHFKEQIEKNYKYQKKVSFYASELCVTPHHLNEIVKNVTAKTASEVIRERLMLEAKRMLVHSHDPIGQIADELGYNDFSYFSRQFKKHNQLSPDQYRIKMHEKYQIS